MLYMKKFLLLVLILASFGSCQNSNEITVRIAYLPVVHALPLYYAVEKGMFEQEGIKIELTSFQAPNQIVDALLSGNADIGADSSTATGITGISQTKKPDSLKIFSLGGNDESIINDLLVTHKDSDISAIIDLKGKVLGILPGIQWRTIAHHILKQNGLADDDVTIQGIPPAMQVQALAAKQIDALLTVEPARAIAFDKGIARDIIRTPVVTHVAKRFYSGCGVVRTEFLKQHPKLAKKIINIFKKAAKEAAINLEDSRIYLAKYTPLSLEVAKKVDSLIFKTFDEFDEVDRVSVQKFFDIFYTHGVIDRRVTTEEVFLTAKDFS